MRFLNTDEHALTIYRVTCLEGGGKGTGVLILKALLVNSCCALGRGFAHQRLFGPDSIAFAKSPASRYVALKPFFIFYFSFLFRGGVALNCC